MTPNEMMGTRLYTALFAATMLSACASEALGPAPTIDPQPGHAFLKIVGDKNVFLDYGASRELTVKYVNDADEGLAGEVQFEIKGTANGARLTNPSGVTGPGGEVRIGIIGGSGSEAFFTVEARAEYATSVNWAVSVRNNSQPPLPFKVEGTYRLESNFDLVSGVPGDVGEVLRTIIDMTDNVKPTGGVAQDPTTWLLDLDQGVADTLKPARPALDAFINTLLKELTMVNINGQQVSIVAKFQEFGAAFGDVAKKFGIKSKLEITKNANGTYTAKHTIDGVFFKIGTRRVDKTLAEMNMDNIVVSNIPITVTGETQVSIGEHNIGLSYGKLIVFALDNVVIPLVTPRATNLREMFADLVDCAMFGQEAADYTGILNAGFYEALCDTAIAAGGAIIEGKLSEVGGTASEFKIHGETRPADSNGDRTVDTLVGGLWEGRLMLGNESATLAKPSQTFTGSRMQ
jgi:hypothetical protein